MDYNFSPFKTNVEVHSFHAQIHNKMNFIDNSTIIKLTKNIGNIFLLLCNKTLKEFMWYATKENPLQNRKQYLVTINKVILLNPLALLYNLLTTLCMYY